MSDNWNTPKWLMEFFKGLHDPCPENFTVDGLTSEWGGGLNGL